MVGLTRSKHVIAVQGQISEVAVAAERALAAALQQHAHAIGLPEWAGQVVTNAAGEQWFGGMELRPSNASGALDSSEVREIEPGVQIIRVRDSRLH